MRLIVIPGHIYFLLFFKAPLKLTVVAFRYLIHTISVVQQATATSNDIPCQVVQF